MNHPAITTIARSLLAAIFVLSGVAKLGAGYAPTAAWMASMGVSGALLPLVIAVEIGAGLALLAGLLTRWAALGLAVFTLAAGLLFHADASDPNQITQLLKSLAITGGLLLLAADGGGRWSLDRVLAARRTVRH